jgi:hypothetical protein
MAIQSILTLFFTEQKIKLCMQDYTMAHTAIFSKTALVKNG